MIVEKQNILELKIKLWKTKMACAEIGKQIDMTTDPVAQEKLRIKLRQEKNEQLLLTRYIEKIEELYEIAKNGDVLAEKVEIPDEQIEKMCNDMQAEFSAKDYNSSVFEK